MDARSACKGINKIIFIVINAKNVIKGNNKITNFAINATNVCGTFLTTINLNAINAVVIN